MNCNKEYMKSKKNTLPKELEKQIIILRENEKQPTLKVKGYPKYSKQYPLSNNPLTIYIDTSETISLIDLELEFDSNKIQSTGNCDSGNGLKSSFSCKTNDPINKILISGEGWNNDQTGKIEVANAEFKWIDKTKMKSVVPVKVKILGLSYGKSSTKPETLKISKDIKNNSYLEYKGKRYIGGEYVLDSNGKINYVNDGDVKVEKIKTNKSKLKKEAEVTMKSPVIYTTPNELKNNWADNAQINGYCNRKDKQDSTLHDGQFCKLRCANGKWGSKLKYKNGKFDVSQYTNFKEYCDEPNMEIYKTPGELKDGWGNGANLNSYCMNKLDKQLEEGQFCRLECPNRRWGGPLKFKNGQFDVSQYSNFEDYCVS